MKKNRIIHIEESTEVRVGLECATMWVGGQCAIAQMDLRLYNASLRLEFFSVRVICIEMCVSLLLELLIGHTVYC